MREYLSPGVYTLEYDKSFLLSAPAAGSVAVFIGGFTKGQAFIPMQITDTNDLLARTGLPNGKFYSQYAALEYSKHKGGFWVQRLLWLDGYSSSAYAVVGISGSTADVLSILAPIGTSTISVVAPAIVSGSGFSTNLQFTTSGSAVGVTPYTLSADNVQHIEDIFGTNPYQPSKSCYLFDNYSDVNFSTAGYTSVSIIKVDNFINHTGKSYDHAVTPWISNTNGDQLFRIHHTSDGTYTNRDIKIAILGVNTSSTLEYAKFDVIVRAYDDDDKKPVILLTFYEVDLNPASDSYIGKRIGDMYSEYNTTYNKLKLIGDFPNNSKYIRVELSDNVKSKNVAKLGAPYRVARIPAAYSSSIVVWDYPTVHTTTGSWPTRNFFNHQGYDVSLNSVKALSNPMGISASINNWSVATAYDTFTGNYIVPLYGGFDGKNPTTGYETDETTLMGFDVSSTSASGYDSYTKALDIIKNVELFNIDVISIAGINLLTTGAKKDIFEYALEEVCLTRGDCIVVADTSLIDEMSYEVAASKTLPFDSSFGAAYYPAVKIKDTYTKTYPIIPVSTLIPAVIAYTEIVSQPHYAPAGINRGTLNVLQAVSKLNRSERDILYKYNVNPIATFAGNGTVVWGQKTLQKTASALDRLNVRILINRIKKWILNYGRTVLFDNNTTTLRQIFTLGVLNYLNSIVASNGLYAYKFVMDESNNTADVIDRNQLVGEVWLKPTKTALFIIIPINIVRTDAEL